MSSRRTAGGATGKAGGPPPSRQETRRQRRLRTRGDPAGRRGRGAFPSSPTVVPLIPLALLAGGLPLFVWSALGDQTGLPRLAASFWLAGCALIALSWMDAWARIPWRVVAAPCLLLVACLAGSAVATAIGVDPARSLLGEYKRYQGIIPLTMYAAMMVAALAAVAYAGSSRPLLMGVFAGGVLSAAYGVLQWLGLDWVRWAGLPEGRIGGAFAQPDLLGIELVAAAAAATGLLPDAGFRTRNAVLGGVALMLLAIVLTLSRGAFLGVIAAAAVLVLFNLWRLPPWRSALLYAAPVILVVAGAALVAPQGRTTLRRAWERTVPSGASGDVAITQRIGFWRTSLHMAADRPILGAGPDAFSQLFGAYRTQDQPGVGTDNRRPESSHNIFFDRLVDSGVVGLALLLGLIGASIWIGVRALPALEPAPRAEVVAMLAALAGYYAAVLFLFAEPMTGWIPWILMGAVAGVAASAAPLAGADARPQPGRRPDPWLPMTIRVAAGVAGVAFVVAGLVLVAGDFYAGRAARLAQRGDVRGAVDSARASTRWDPLQPQYLLGLGFYQEGAAQAGDAGQRLAALSTYHRLNAWFQPTAFGLVREAQAQANVAFATPEERDRVFALLEQAVSLDPNNAEVRQGIADFYTAAGEPERAKPHLAWLEQAGVAKPPPAP